MKILRSLLGALLGLAVLASAKKDKKSVDPDAKQVPTPVSELPPIDQALMADGRFTTLITLAEQAGVLALLGGLQFSVSK